MKICVDCFDDVDIKTRIQSLNKRDICNIHSKEELIFDSDIDSQLNIQTDLARLLNLYEPVNIDINTELSSSELLKSKTLIDRIQSDWDIFSKKLSENDITCIIFVLLKELVDVNSNAFFSKPLRMKRIYNTEFIETNSVLIGDSWESFKENILHKNRFFNKDLNVNLLKNLMGLSVSKLDAGQILYRARIVEDFNEIKAQEDLLIPPENKRNAIEGRLNPRGIGMLYLADTENTALKEVRASFNDNVVVAPVKIKSSVRVVDLTQIMHVSPFIMLDTNFPQVYQLNKEFISTFVKELEKPVKAHPKNLEYLPTQYLSAIAQTKYTGIKYRSTMRLKDSINYQDQLNYNVVLFGDDNVITSVEKISKYRINKIDYGRIKIN